MNYYKRHWDETTSNDLTDSWGTSTYYFEVSADNHTTRQLQVFKNGKGLKYHDEHMDDDYGGLGDQPLDIKEFEKFKIDKSAFENIWTITKHL